MSVRMSLIAAILVAGSAGPVFAQEDQALRAYDRESLDYLFEQAQTGRYDPNAIDDDMLITGSVSSASDKKDGPEKSGAPSTDRPN